MKTVVPSDVLGNPFEISLVHPEMIDGIRDHIAEQGEQPGAAVSSQQEHERQPALQSDNKGINVPYPVAIGPFLADNIMVGGADGDAVKRIPCCLDDFPEPWGNDVPAGAAGERPAP